MQTPTHDRSAHRHPAQLRGRRLGFSLMELIVVLVMIAIMIALGAPRINVDRFYMDGALEEASTAFMVAQREAVGHQHNVLMVIDTVNRSLKAVWDVNNNAREDAGEHTRVTALTDRMRFARPSSVPPQGSNVPILSPMADCSGLPCLIFQRNGSIDREAFFYLTSLRSTRPGGGRDEDARFVVLARANARPDTWKYTGVAWRPFP
jgi:prepilin-type N-terminal cleavage/methylation domain-containing protein